MGSTQLEALMSKLTPASTIRETCQSNKAQQVQSACSQVKQFVDSVMEPTLKYIDSMVRSSADLSPDADYILLMHDSVFKHWSVTIDETLYIAFNESRGEGYCKNLTDVVTVANFPVKAVNIVLEQLRPVLEASGYRLQLCMRYGASTEHDCFDIIWGRD
jgi:hypothetical protein